MLVKLGKTWVDPTEVIFISSSQEIVSMSVKEDGYVGAFPLSQEESQEKAEEIRDLYASIVNNALQTSSYGVGDEKENQKDS